MTKETIARYWSPERQAQLEERRQQAALLRPGDHARVASAIHMEKLLDPSTEPRTQLGYIRTAYEINGQIGNNPSALHLHKHEGLSPDQAEMIAKAVRRAFGEDEKVIDIEVER
jgi:hypothetical protein